MVRRWLQLGLIVTIAALAWPGVGVAQQGDPDHEWCDDGNWGNRDADRYCEVRELTLPANRDLIRVSGGANGGIRVEGWDRNEISVTAKIQTWDRRGDDAETLAGEIRIVTDRIIEADGPRLGRRSGWRDGGWAVSFRLMVPRRSNLSLRTVNGGIDILEVAGSIDFEATNGGIDLELVAGDVRGQTTNGGIRVLLDGSRWEGRGLDIETTNGGVTLVVPEDYQAKLETGTVNGGFRIDFPITIQGRINRRRITTDLNGGGPPIRAVTTNGGVTVRRR